MAKLATPIQYESALDRLNAVRPLQLADEAKIALNIPVLNVNPVDKDKPVVGKLLRCNQQGVLLRSNDKAQENSEYKSFFSYCRLCTFHFPFAQKVFGVIVTFVDPAEIFTVWWCSEAAVVKYKQITKDVWTFLPFVGIDFYLRFESAVYGAAVPYLYGFY